MPFWAPLVSWGRWKLPVVNWCWFHFAPSIAGVARSLVKAGALKMAPLASMTPAVIASPAFAVADVSNLCILNKYKLIASWRVLIRRWWIPCLYHLKLHLQHTWQFFWEPFFLLLSSSFCTVKARPEKLVHVANKCCAEARSSAAAQICKVHRWKGLSGRNS